MHRIDPKIIKGIAALVITDQLITGAINARRANKNAALANHYREVVIELSADAQKLEAQVEYLVNKLNEFEVPMTEFDAIAFNNL